MPGLQINEIYKSIQGESLWAGLPTVFVRTTGCPVRCVYCDTEYAFHGGKRLEVESICNTVAQYRPVEHVCITGGEPLAQHRVIDLIAELNRRDYQVSLETSGVRSIREVPRPCKIVLDVKTPESGVADAWLPENIDYLQSGDELKAVIVSRSDWDWWLEWLKQNQTKLAADVALSVSPAMPSVTAQQLADWLIETDISVRLNLQLHKFIWPNDSQGR